MSAADVGRRIAVRRRAGTENGRTVFTDVLGVLEAWTADDVLVIRRRDGASERVAWSQVVAGRTIPFQARGRSPHTGGGLARIAAAGWPAAVVEPLGDWLLQATDGFTGRANSVVPAGDPGLPLDAALDRVRQFYARHRLPPRIQTIIGTDLERDLIDRGWQPASSGKHPIWLVDVQIAPLPAVLGRLPARRRDHPAAGAEAGDANAATVELGGGLDRAWTGRYGRDGVDTAAARRVLGGPVRDDLGEGGIPGGGRIALARIPDSAAPDGGEPLGIARGVVTGPWLGIAALEVAPQARRRGLGLALITALCRWGTEQGALWAYLQVGTDEAPAKALYDKLGFRTDHQYRYLQPSA